MHHAADDITMVIADAVFLCSTTEEDLKPVDTQSGGYNLESMASHADGGYDEESRRTGHGGGKRSSTTHVANEQSLLC